MAKDIDDLLTALSGVADDRALDGLERAVWSRVEDRRRQGGLADGLRVQAAVAVAALALGIAMSSAGGPRAPVRTEMIVLSEDAGLAPSIAVEGGA